MIKLTVEAKEFCNHIVTSVNGNINGHGDLLVYEMAHVLEEFKKINNGDELDAALQLLIEKWRQK